MRSNYFLSSLGSIGKPDSRGFPIKVYNEYKEALTGLEGFSWINIIWWADKLDNNEERQTITAEKPYTNGPEKLGIFATRSPSRPNPVMITACMVAEINLEEGIIYTPYIDAEPGSPLLDIKPYHGCTDRAADWEVPDWCKNGLNLLKHLLIFHGKKCSIFKLPLEEQ